MLQLTDQFPAASCIENNRILCPLVHLGFRNLCIILQKIKQSVRLRITHTVLHEMDTHASPDFMLNYKLHVNRLSSLVSSVTTSASSKLSASAFAARSSLISLAPS